MLRLDNLTDLISLFKEVIDHVLDLINVVLGRSSGVKSLLHELSLDSGGHLLTWINHTSWYGPDSSILPLNTNKL